MLFHTGKSVVPIQREGEMTKSIFAKVSNLISDVSYHIDICFWFLHSLTAEATFSELKGLEASPLGLGF